MALNLVKIGVAAGVGVVDEILERQDAAAGRAGTSFTSWRNLGRIGMAVGGFGLGIFMPRQEALGETIGIAATPLLVKTLAAIAMNEGAKKTNFTPRTVAGPSVRNWAPGGSGPGAYRGFAVTRS